MSVIETDTMPTQVKEQGPAMGLVLKGIGKGV